MNDKYKELGRGHSWCIWCKHVTAIPSFSFRHRSHCCLRALSVMFGCRTVLKNDIIKHYWICLVLVQLFYCNICLILLSLNLVKIFVVQENKILYSVPNISWESEPLNSPSSSMAKQHCLATCIQKVCGLNLREEMTEIPWFPQCLAENASIGS
jgi:hypothetical protein